MEENRTDKNPKITQSPKKLYLSDTDKLIAGVMGGIGEYFNIDPTVIRVGYVVLTVVSFFWLGIILYIFLWAIIPSRSNSFLKQ
jgi:phage shock protein C